MRISRAVSVVLVLAGLAGCKPDLHGPWPKPALAAHRSPLPSDADGLAEELRLGQKNFFALQEFYLCLGEGGFPKKMTQVHELTAEERSWVDAAASAESEDLGRLLPAMEKALKDPVTVEDRPVPGTPRVSLAVFLEEGPWDLAALRANHAGNLAYLHGVRRSRRATEVQKADAVKWSEESRLQLAEIERDSKRRR